MSDEAWHRGNFAEAYETRTCVVPEEYTPRQRLAYLLGFYASYELHEIDDEEHREEVARWRAEHPDD